MAPSGESDEAADEKVLSPEELDIAAAENVEQLDEGRFVIGADGPPDRERIEARRAATDEAAAEDTPAEQSVADTDGSDTSQPADDISGAAVKRWLADELTQGDSRYAYRIAAKTGDEVRHQQLASDDIGVAFDSLLLWYARQVGAGTAVEEALGILLAESDIRVRYPTPRLLDFLEEHDLGPDDSIADLVNVVHEADGLVFPQRQRDQK